MDTNPNRIEMPEDTPPNSPVNGGELSAATSWKKFAAVICIWVIFIVAIIVFVLHGMPEKAWDLLDKWIWLNSVITGAFFGIDAYLKKTKV